MIQFPWWRKTLKENQEKANIDREFDFEKEMISCLSSQQVTTNLFPDWVDQLFLDVLQLRVAAYDQQSLCRKALFLPLATSKAIWKEMTYPCMEHLRRKLDLFPTLIIPISHLVIDPVGCEINYKTFFNLPITSWLWNYLDPKKHWCKNEWDRKRRGIGLFIPVQVLGMILAFSANFCTILSICYLESCLVNWPFLAFLINFVPLSFTLFNF